MYRTGSVDGDTGPTIFLYEGKKRRGAYTDKFLREYSAAEGSTIIMTPNAFMNIEAWEEMTPYVCLGIRAINKIVSANRQWWILEIFDGFGAYLSSLKAMKIRHTNKVLSLKEEGDSSHVNQAYDKYVAKADKSAKAECLAMQRNCIRVNEGVVNQWGLVLTGLFAIRTTTRETWTKSFRACNLDQWSRLSLGNWCKKIEQYLVAGQSFKFEGNLDIYPLLPSWWHGMTPLEMKLVVETVKKHGGYTVMCIQELRDRCHIPPKDLSDILVCVECTNEKVDQLEMGLPIAPLTELVDHEVVAAEAAMKSAMSGLKHFEFKPEGMKGKELSAHMIKYREIRNRKNDAKNRGKLSSPSQYLTAEVSNSN